MSERRRDYTVQSGRSLIFVDDFDGPCLDQGKWFPFYLPHWSSPEAGMARFRIADSRVRLFIADDQEPWCPEFDGDVKVSNLQTGHYAGPLGSRTGQHRFRDGLIVRSELPEQRLFLPRYCRLEMKARARLNPWNLAALWLIGFGNEQHHSGEITVFEAFGHDCSGSVAQIGRGIKKINDPALSDELDKGELRINVQDWHIYAMDWTPAGVEFFVDGKLVTRTRQSPDYPMQLMLNFYDLPDGRSRENASDAWFDVDYIKAYGEPT
ncbi:glycoside hydrolase family 16 protein [Litchfieldella rifensis]|uniref:Glycoside hydrolase family 16 protein n=1 Tax=Litchfieldella rifensis TaxID=762643 RepID=A0ABV7LK89_9GAMM